MFSVINGKSLTSQRVQLSHPTDRLPRPVLSPSNGRSAPLDKKTFKCLNISRGNRKEIKNLYKRLSENTRRRLWYLSERISARHFVPSTFLKIMILQNPCLHLSPRSPESCCPQEAGWVAEVLDIVCCLFWRFFISDGDCERSHIGTYDIWHMTWTIILTYHGWVWDSVIYHRVHSYCHWITGEHLLILILISSYFMLSVTRKYLGQWPIYYSLQADITTPKNNSRKWLFSGQKWFLRQYFNLIRGMFVLKSGLRFSYQPLEVPEPRIRKRPF